MARILVLVLLLWSVGCGVSPPQSSSRTPAIDISKAGMAPERVARISSRMKEFVEDGTIAGAVTLIARHGVVVSLDAVGYQQLETRTPMRTDSIFQIRSMTKPMTAVGIMILREEGRLRLSDAISKYVPEFHGLAVVDTRERDKGLTTKKPARPITVRDLLTHTSGMSADADTNEAGTSLAESVAALAKVPLEFEPGTKFLYSDAGFETLGRVIEVASRQPYENFMKQRILQPLGMNDSFFFPPPEKCHRIASHYEPQAGKLKRYEGSLNPDWHTREGCRAYMATIRHPGPSWGMFSTASDTAVFHQMTLNGGSYKGARILSRASVETMTAVQTGELSGLRSPQYGFGWFVQPGGEKPGFLPPGVFFHEGLRGTLGWVDPQQDAIGILMIQLEPAEGQNTVHNSFIAMTYAALAGD
jgi:CubicO group peptidase (beta-lactamase class C family)